MRANLSLDKDSWICKNVQEMKYILIARVNKMEKIAVLGAGAMGTAVAFHLSNTGHQVNLWGTELDEQIIKTRKQEKLGINIPESINGFHFN